MPSNPEVEAILARARAERDAAHGTGAPDVAAIVARARAERDTPPDLHGDERTAERGVAAPSVVDTTQTAPLHGGERAARPGVDAPATTDSPADAIADTGAGVVASVPFATEAAAGVAAPFTDAKYTQLRNALRQRQDLAAQRSPLLHGVGELGGTAALTALTGGLGKGTSWAQGSAKRLAAEGAVVGAGQAQSSDPNDVAGAGDYVAPVGLGAVSALASGKLMQKGADIAGLGSGPRLHGQADEAMRAADRARVAAAHLNPAQIERQPGGVAGQAEAMREHGVSTGLSRATAVETQSVHAIDKINEARKLISERAHRRGVLVPGGDIADKIDALASGQAGEGTKAEGIRAELSKIATGYREGKRSLSFGQANQERAFYGAEANFADSSPSAVVNPKVHKIVNDAMEAALDQADPGSGKLWRKLGSQEAALIRARTGAEAKLGRVAQGQQPSFGGKAAAAAGMLQGGSPVAAGYVAVNSGLRNYGHSIEASVKERSARILGQRAARTDSVAKTSIGRALQRAVLPTSSTIARTESRHVAADHGAESVQQASPEDQARAHYIQSQTNPDYRMDVARPGE